MNHNGFECIYKDKFEKHHSSMTAYPKMEACLHVLLASCSVWVNCRVPVVSTLQYKKKLVRISGLILPQYEDCAFRLSCLFVCLFFCLFRCDLPAHACPDIPNHRGHSGLLCVLGPNSRDCYSTIYRGRKELI